MTMLRACDPPDLLNFLNSGAPFNKANLLTLTLASGVVVRLTDYDVGVHSTALGTFAHNGPPFSRSQVTHRRGVEVDTMTIKVHPRPTDLLGTTPWMTSIRAGALDYAAAQLDIAVFELASPTVLRGTFNWFYGKVADIPEVDAMGAQIECKSELSRLNILMPRNLVQPGCLNTLFDTACGLQASAWQTAGTVISVNSDGSLVTNLSNPSGFFDEGRLVISTGDNSNVVRKIKQNVDGTLRLFSPFVFPITPGTTFLVYPGCDKTKARCAVFNNSNNFRGLPYVPTPERVL